MVLAQDLPRGHSGGVDQAYYQPKAWLACRIYLPHLSGCWPEASEFLAQ